LLLPALPVPVALAWPLALVVLLLRVQVVVVVLVGLLAGRVVLVVVVREPWAVQLVQV
jgi:hypothetical protein